MIDTHTWRGKEKRKRKNSHFLYVHIDISIRRERNLNPRFFFCTNWCCNIQTLEEKWSNLNPTFGCFSDLVSIPRPKSLFFNEVKIKRERAKLVVVIWSFPSIDSLFECREEWMVVTVERWHQLRRVHLRRSSGNSPRYSASGRPAKKYKKVK